MSTTHETQTLGSGPETKEDAPAAPPQKEQEGTKETERPKEPERAESEFNILVRVYLEDKGDGEKDDEGSQPVFDGELWELVATQTAASAERARRIWTENLPFDHDLPTEVVAVAKTYWQPGTPSGKVERKITWT